MPRDFSRSTSFVVLLSLAAVARPVPSAAAALPFWIEYGGVKTAPEGPHLDFDGRVVGLPWQFVRNPEPSGFSLSERAGFLRLRTGPRDLDDKRVRNVILQREVSLRYDATTRLEFAPGHGEQAGLVCLYDSATWLRIGLTGAPRRLVLERFRHERRDERGRP